MALPFGREGVEGSRGYTLRLPKGLKRQRHPRAEVGACRSLTRERSFEVGPRGLRGWQRGCSRGWALGWVARLKGDYVPRACFGASFAPRRWRIGGLSR